MVRPQRPVVNDLQEELRAQIFPSTIDRADWFTVRSSGAGSLGRVEAQVEGDQVPLLL